MGGVNLSPVPRSVPPQSWEAALIPQHQWKARGQSLAWMTVQLYFSDFQHMSSLPSMSPIDKRSDKLYLYTY